MGNFSDGCGRVFEGEGGKRESSLTVTEGRKIGGWRWERRGIYREVLILLATLSLLTSTEMKRRR
jgi:hypothetical protein